MATGKGILESKLESAVFTEMTEADPLELQRWEIQVVLTRRVKINQRLSKLGWMSLMSVLKNSKVSDKIKHLILPMDFRFRSDHDLILLAGLLETGRFSSLESLLLQTTFDDNDASYLNFRSDVIDSRHPFAPRDLKIQHRALPGTLYLGRALVKGNLLNLQSLSVSNCYVIPILEAVIDSSFELKSFSMSFIRDSSAYTSAYTRVDQSDYSRYLECLPNIIIKVFNSGRFSHLEHLGLTHGALSVAPTNVSDWEDLKTAMEVESRCRVLKSLQLTGNELSYQLEDWAKGGVFDYLELLEIMNCEISSFQVSAFMDRVINKGKALTLKLLDLSVNPLNDGVESIVRLANSNLLQQLQELNLRNTIRSSTRSSTLETVDKCIAGLVKACN